MRSVSKTKVDNQVRTYKRAVSEVFSKTKEGFGGLSNMASGFPVRVNGVRILTSEALYQACRFPHLPDVQRLIIGQLSPMTAKMKSKPYRNGSRPDWNRVRVKVMRWCLRVKLAQNWSEFSRLLLATGDRAIVEESRKDDFWGAKAVDDDTLIGMNILGRLLMELRKEIKHSDSEQLRRVEPLPIPDFLLFGEAISAVEVRPMSTAASTHSPATGMHGVNPVQRQHELSPAADRVEQPSLFDSPIPASARPARGEALIDTLKPYPEYKQTGLPWLGEVPGHWETGPGFAAFREKQVKNTGMAEKQVLSLSYGRIVIKPPEKLHGLVPDSFETYQIVDPGDIIIRSTDLQNDWNSLRVGLVRDRGIITSAYLCFRTTGTLIPEYGYQMLHAFDLMKVFYGMGSGLRQNLSFLDFKRMPIFVPPSDEQAAIVRFLDHANRRMDRFIRAKKKVIALFNEQRQAIIHQAVTRGLDPNVRLKPSGLDQLGDVPEHWEMRKVKQVAQLLVSNVDKISLADETPIRLCNYNDVYKNEVISEEIGFMVASATKDEIVKFRLRNGDVIITKDSEMWNDIGVPALVAYEAPDLVCGYHLAILRPDAQQMHSEFLLRCFQDPLLVTQLHIRANGITRYGLSQHAIKDCLVPVPPINDQVYICAMLQRDLAVINTEEVKARHQIDLLREYRTRLIADVVTGKLDVRSLEMPTVEEAEVLNELDTGEEAEAGEMTHNDEAADGDEQ
jgi:type I restriction enzyme S subunit